MNKNFVFGLSLFVISLIFVLILQHQNSLINEQNAAIEQKRIEDSIKKADDSLKIELIKLDAKQDSIKNARKIDSLIHKGRTIIINKKLKKDEAVVKILPNSTVGFRDSLWINAK